MAVEALAQELRDAHDKATAALHKTAETMKKRHDEHRAPAREYQPGDKVYLSTENLPTIRATKKLDGKFVGPLEVVKKVGASAYQLKIPASWRVYNVFNEVHLKPYKEPVFPTQQEKVAQRKELQMVEESEDDEYEVEEVMDSRVSGRGGGRLEYLVKWKNYPVEESTWEPAENLSNAKKRGAEIPQGKS